MRKRALNPPPGKALANVGVATARTKAAGRWQHCKSFAHCAIDGPSGQGNGAKCSPLKQARNRSADSCLEGPQPPAPAVAGPPVMGSAFGPLLGVPGTKCCSTVAVLGCPDCLFSAAQTHAVKPMLRQEERRVFGFQPELFMTRLSRVGSRSCRRGVSRPSAPQPGSPCLSIPAGEDARASKTLRMHSLRASQQAES